MYQMLDTSVSGRIDHDFAILELGRTDLLLEVLQA